jgi:hypothetical protein
MDHCGAAAAIYPFKLPPLCAYMPVRNKLALAGHFDSGLAGSESPSVDRGSGQRPFAQMRRAPCGAVGLFPGVAEIAHETRGAFISAYDSDAPRSCFRLCGVRNGAERGPIFGNRPKIDAPGAGTRPQ